jgi:predicted RNA methylase
VLKHAELVRAGEVVSDEEFDAVYTPDIRSLSFLHWSPVAVAMRAAQMLTEMGATRILDVGAGAGKFCIIGSLSSPIHFTGAEQRRNLVEVARTAALRLGADRTRFVHANIVDFDWDPFNGFYLYNPFQEQVEHDLHPIDQTLTRSSELHRTYVASTIAKLIRAPIGTAVVTYSGFGGVMPPQYRRVHRQEFRGAGIVLWVRGGYSKMLPRRLSAESAGGRNEINP